MTLSLLEPKDDQLGNDLTLEYWSAYDLPAASSESGVPRIFAGLLKEHGHKAWVSEPIYSFNALEAAGKTTEGRVYRLVGIPGHPAPVVQAWSEWKQVHCVRRELDVMEEVFLSILLAQGMAKGAEQHRQHLKART